MSCITITSVKSNLRNEILKNNWKTLNVESQLNTTNAKSTSKVDLVEVFIPFDSVNPNSSVTFGKIKNLSNQINKNHLNLPLTHVIKKADGYILSIEPTSKIIKELRNHFENTDDSIDNYFNNEKNDIENSRKQELENVNEEVENKENLTEEELNRIDVVNARHDMQQEVLERTRQDRLEDFEDNQIDNNLTDEIIDESINNNPVLTAASIITPGYDSYLKNKEALLKKVQRALSKLYTINGKNKNTATISNINKLNNLEASIQEDITKFNDGSVTQAVIEEFFNKDIDIINELLDTNDFNNLYLAQDLLSFLETNLDTTNSNSMFNSIDKKDSFIKVLDDIANKKKKIERKLEETYENLFLNLLDKHYISFKRLPKYAGKSLTEIKEILLKELDDASFFSNEALSIDKNLTTEADVTRQLARLELELEQEKEKLLISPAINKINNAIEKTQVELKRLGKLTSVFGKSIYNYDMFLQKDAKGNKNYTLINKFSSLWFDYKQEVTSSYNRRINDKSIDIKERNIALTEQYNEINSNADFINFTLLHDIFTDNTLDGFKNTDTVSAQNYKNSLISKIGKENYDDLVNEQRTKLQLFLEKKNEITNKKIIAQNLIDPAVIDYDSLPDVEKNKLKISIDTLNPLLFLDAHFNYNTNKIPILLGTQNIDFPAKLNYVSYIPKNAEHYNSDFDLVDEKQNPVLYEMYQALKEANDVVKDGLLGTSINLESGQLINSNKNFRETLMDKSYAELAINGLGHLVNLKEHYLSVKQLLKNAISTKTETKISQKENVNEIKLSGQIITVEKLANRDYSNNVIELKNILGKNLKDNSSVNWQTLIPGTQKQILDLLDVDNLDDVLDNGKFDIIDLKQYSINKIVAEQSMNIPLLMKANLDLVSEHKSRVNSRNTISVLLNRINKTNLENNETNAKSSVKLEHWVKKNILNKNINNVNYGKLTRWFAGKDNYETYRGTLRSDYYKNFTQAEKKLFDSYTKRITNIETQLNSPTINPKVSKALIIEKEGLEQSIVLMGKDYTAGALAESLFIKIPFLAGLAWNQVAPIKNFLNGMVMVINRDGQFWTEGNANIAMHHILGHPVKMLGNKMNLNDHQEEWKKTVLFIESLRVIENQTSELQKGEENSKILNAGNFFTDGMYFTKKVEWINQSVSLMARAMDKEITHPTQTNTDGTPYKIKMFDGQKFEAHEIVNGQLVLKQEWKSPENDANFERMDSPEMLLWKIENKRVNASLNGDYSQEGSILGKRYFIGRVASQFKTWVSQFLYDRFAYKQTDLALGIEHSGFYVGPIMNTKTRPAAIATFILKSALAGLVTANFAGGAAIAIPAAAMILMAYNLRKNRQSSPLPLLKSIGKGLKDMNWRSTWNQTKYVGYNSTIGLGLTTANIATGVILGKNYIPKVITDFEKTMQSEEDKQNFKNLQLLTKNFQSNLVTTMISMLFMALRGSDKDDDKKNEEQDSWYINAILNLTANIYSESAFADNPIGMYQALVEKQGANTFMDKIGVLALMITHMEDDTLKSGDHKGDSKLARELKKTVLPMMIRNIDKIGTTDYLLGFESLVGKYYKQGSPMENLFNSDLKNEVKRRKNARADVKEDIKESMEDSYDVSKIKNFDKKVNSLAQKGYRNKKTGEKIKGVPAINKDKYDENEELKKK